MNCIAITLDIDWAPDFIIDAVAAMLSEVKIRATWFVTHCSPAIERLRGQSDLFELGIHPNFLPGSTHGNTPTEILRHCMELVPEATAMRTHALVQSGPLMQTVLSETSIQTDVSLFLPRMPHIIPVEYRKPQRTLIRVPYFWEDHSEVESPQTCWHFRDDVIVNGVKIFNFHPTHVYLNMPDLSIYDRVKRLGQLQELSPNDVNLYVHSGEGVGTLFRELIDFVNRQGNSLRICDIVEMFQHEKDYKEGE